MHFSAFCAFVNVYVPIVDTGRGIAFSLVYSVFCAHFCAVSNYDIIKHYLIVLGQKNTDPVFHRPRPVPLS